MTQTPRKAVTVEQLDRLIETLKQAIQTREEVHRQIWDISARLQPEDLTQPGMSERIKTIVTLNRETERQTIEAVQHASGLTASKPN